MADVSLDYGTIDAVSTELKNAVANIVPQLQALQARVDGLLAKDGGLWLNATSPALQNAYHTFNTSLTNAVNSINDFATQFTGIAGQMKSMDSQMANQINNPGQ